MSNPKKSSRRWLREHFKDPYVKEAHRQKLRSRANFKLQELDARDKLFKPGMTIIDLGAAPGGWSEFLVQKVGKKGRIIAMDILPITPIVGVEFILGDFNDDKIIQSLFASLNNQKVDWVISDMSPNLSGILSVDQPRSMNLAEAALELALQVIQKDGGFLVKVFQGEGFDELLAKIKHNFYKVTIRKPPASRSRSREVYILAKTLR